MSQQPAICVVAPSRLRIQHSVTLTSVVVTYLLYGAFSIVWTEMRYVAYAMSHMQPVCVQGLFARSV